MDGCKNARELYNILDGSMGSNRRMDAIAWMDGCMGAINQSIDGLTRWILNAMG